MWCSFLNDSKYGSEFREGLERRYVTVNNVTIVPIERLTDEELDLYERMAAKGRAIPIETAVLPPETEPK
jgi:hypothetical protein